MDTINIERAAGLIRLTDKAYWPLRRLIDELVEHHGMTPRSPLILELEHSIEMVLGLEQVTKDQAGIEELDEEAE